MSKKEEQEILKRYKARLGKHTDKTIASPQDLETFSKEYRTFKQEVLGKQRSRYETWCNKSEKFLAIAPPKKQVHEIEKAIETIHLDITPVGATSFATIAGFSTILFGFLFAAIMFALTTQIKLFIPLLCLLVGLLVVKFVARLPIYLAARWRLKASNQMVLCILYVVMYMRHTSNLEHAIRFAAQHVGPPLSLDLRKIFWDTQTRKYPTIKEALDNYLETWRHYNMEFITSFHLIESSLFEPTESRRLDLLDKALNVMLEGTYDKMLHYAQDLKNPITTLHMLGVVLPILGLVIFPLVGSFLGGLIGWQHLFIIYNIFLPFGVFAFGLNALSKRPTGFSATTTQQGLLQKIKSPTVSCALIATFFIALGFLPVIFHILDPRVDFNVGVFGNFFNYITIGNNTFGPFGLGALLLSFAIPFGCAVALGTYYKSKTRNLIKLRKETKNLEKEFASALFQLGNRIGDGIPAEMAFSNVAQVMTGTPTGKFFRIVDTNIRQLGMSMPEAIFNEKTGAILTYPSAVIRSSMEVLIESAQKGPKIVAESLISVANYIERINKVNERLKDLLAEVISSMKAQISFLTPAIAGIVVGISAMIVNIIVTLNTKFTEFVQNPDALGATSQLQVISEIFNVQGVIPGFYFQLVVGLYVVQLTYILSVLQNSIENGTDKIAEQHLLGKNMTRSVYLYIGIAAVVTVLFSLLSQGILAGTEF